jgi:hypothetical protein
MYFYHHILNCLILLRNLEINIVLIIRKLHDVYSYKNYGQI